MATPKAERVLRHLRQVLEGVPAVQPADRQLLQRFVAGRDQEAFAALVRRHGPLVLGVCRRVLGDAHDAEDVFQATFLVLARKAGSIRQPEALPGWLYGVAYRLALKARGAAARRRLLEKKVAVNPAAEPADLTWTELRAALDDELQRLPARHRVPLVLCYLEGKTQDEAARQLGWPRGTLKRRLERGRELLAARLSRRGLDLSAGLLAVALTRAAAPAAVPVALTAATTRAGVLFAAGPAGAAATPAAALARGVLPALPAVKVQVGVALLLVLLAAGAGLVACHALAEKPGVPARPAARAAAQPGRRDFYGDPLPAGALARLGTVRLRHGSMVTGVVFSRDGQTAIAGDDRGNIVSWDVATGQERRRLLPRLRTGVGALALSADGKTLASGSSDGVRLWDVTAGTCTAFLRQGRREHIAQLVFAPDGKTLASAGRGKTVTLWDRAAGKKGYELGGHAGDVLALAFSPDGKTLATAAWADPVVRLWDPATGKERLRLQAHHGGATGVAFAPDGQTLATGGNDYTLRFWDPATGKKLREARALHPFSLRYLPGGRALAGVTPRRVGVWDAATGKLLREFKVSPGSIPHLVLSPDGKTVATVLGGRHTVDLWDVATGQPRHRFEGHRDPVVALAFSGDGRTLFSAAGMSDNGLRAWDPTTGRHLRRVGDDPDGVNALALAPDGQTLAAGGYDDDAIRLWEPATGKEVRCLAGHKEAPDSVAWSGDGAVLLSASQEDKTLRLWDAATGKQRRVIEARQDWPSGAALSPDGRTIAAGGYDDGTVRLWDTATGQELRRLATPHGVAYAAAFTPDGKALASAGQGDLICLWDPARGHLLRRFELPQGGWVDRLAFSADGRTLVSGGGNGVLRLWEVSTGQERAHFTGHRGAVQAVALSPDGRTVASGGADTTALVWDVTGLRSGGPAREALSARRLQDLWQDLGGADAARAYRALWLLAEAPGRSLPFLGERLRPAARPDARQQKDIARLVADLNADDFAARERATAGLEELGSVAEPALRDALDARPGPEARRRIEGLLKAVGQPAGERLRTLRALEAVERAGTAEARDLLRRLAGGAPRAWLTDEARAANERLARQPRP
jgi:RNA polymerase sigma factor (sigma-70 family)